MIMKNRAIGVFDSGVGGFTVLKLLEKFLPYEKFIYVADNLNLPYGEKTSEQIINFSMKIIQWLVSQNVKLIIIACHTSCSAISFEELAKVFPNVQIIGVIQPTIKQTALQNKITGVIATTATIKSNIFEKELQKINSKMKIYSMACPKLAPMIENNEIGSILLNNILCEYLQPFINLQIENIIYGCTHYPHLDHIIKKILPPHITITDPALYLCEEVVLYLQQSNLQNNNAGLTNTSFFITGEKIKFCNLAKLFLQKEIVATQI